MTDWGMTVSNASIQVQIDSTYRNYSFVKSGIAYSQYATYPWLTATFPTQTEPPIVVFKPPLHFPIAMGGVSNTQAWFNTEKNASVMVKYQVWKRGIVTPATWGMNVNNASGDTVFSSEDKHFVIQTVQTGTYTAATKSHQYGSGRHFLGSVNGEYVSVSPAGVRTVYDGDSDLAIIYERGVVWNSVNSNASLTDVGELSNEYQLTGVHLDGEENMQATYSIVGVVDHEKGPGRRWGWNGSWRERTGADELLSEMRSVDATLALLAVGSSAHVSNGGYYDYWSGFPVGFTTGLTGAIASQVFPGILTNYVSALDGVPNGTLCIAGARRLFMKPLMWRSVDRGNTWERTQKLGSDLYPYKIRVLTASIAILSTVDATHAKIYRSNDYAQTWTAVQDFSGSTTGIYSLHNLSGKSALAGGTGVIYKSRDYGKTWSTATRLNVTANAKPAQNAIFDFETVTGSIILCTTSPDAQVWRSTDDGETWTKQADFSATLNVHPQSVAYTVAAFNSTTCFVGTGNNGQIWRSNDGGITWPDLVEETLYSHRANTIVKHLVTNRTATKLIWAATSRGWLWRNFEHHN